MKTLLLNYETCAKLEFRTALRDAYSKFSFLPFFYSGFHPFSLGLIPLSPNTLFIYKIHKKTHQNVHQIRETKQNIR